MGVSWGQISNPVREAIESSLPAIMGAGEQAVANIVWALGNMNATTSHFTPQTLEYIQSGICSACGSFTHQGLSNSLLGLAKMGHNYDHLSPVLRYGIESACIDNKRRSAVVRMHNQPVSNVIWSLGTMQAKWHTYTPTTLSHSSSSSSSSNAAVVSELELSHSGDDDELSYIRDMSVLSSSEATLSEPLCEVLIEVRVYCT